uniref:Avidin n=1 Tax=Calidris pygmaea TaxID=425635 RepID=A0A8C3PIK0_9CHAR
MVQATPFLLLLSLALVAPGLSARKCVLTGDWKNDLGSNMTIGAINGKGEFASSYHTDMSSTTNKIQPSPLLGLQGHGSALTMLPSTSCPVPADSITIFTGQCFMDEDGKEVLKTMWLLRSSVDNMKDDWKATR